jgi:hypothetical protein
MLYQLSYTRVFSGAVISGSAGQSAPVSDTTSGALLTRIVPPRRPAALHGGGRIRTYVGR